MSLERVQWDAENRLVGIVQASGTTGFVYDGAGHTVQETLNGTLIKQWVWCGSQPCEERDGSGNVTKRFYAQGEQIAGTPYYFTRDHLGSVREMTDSTGAIRAQYDYDPFGRVTKIQGNLSADFGFTGDYYHAASGLSLTIYRAYDPNLGRWLSRDPLGEYAGIDVYGYVLNDPVNGSDPFGLWQITISGGDFFGGSITFGNNGGSGWFNGQWNLGAYVGLGEGLSFNFDPNNSGCHDVGADPSLRVAGQLGFGPNVEGQLDIRDVNNLANSDSEITLNPPVIPGLSIPVIQQKNGQISFLNKMPTWGFGESGFAGLGETKYGSAPSKCSCSSSQ
jgi:RHS repeat-associated protein